MFSFLSTTSRSVRPYICTVSTRAFSCFGRVRYSPVRSAEEEAAHDQELERKRIEQNARRRYRYATDPAYRQKAREATTKSYRRPEVRAVINAYHRERNLRDRKEIAKIEARFRQNLSYRRTRRLFELLRLGIAKRCTWKTHTPVEFPERVDLHCTGCHQKRFLRTWWKEKPETSQNLEPSKQPDPHRYMCNHCFANDWPRVVPETWSGSAKKLPGIFRSPELPLSQAQRAERAKEKENESDKPQKKASTI